MFHHDIYIFVDRIRRVFISPPNLGFFRVRFLSNIGCNQIPYVMFRSSLILSDGTCKFCERHIFTMATHLGMGKGLLLQRFVPGKLIAFKSDAFDLRGLLDHATNLDLYNDHNDILLRITIRRGHNKVFFNDRANKSLVDGWGQEQSVDLNPVDISRWRRFGVTISVHDCSTQSSERYQILFDLSTVYIFDKRFLGPAIKVVYQQTLSEVRNIFGMILKCRTP